MVSVEAPAAQGQRCQHCGHMGAVVPFVEWVGGHGYTTIWLCADRLACWTRWEAQNGR